MGNMDPNDVKARQMCTQNCVKMGAKYVLYDPSSKATYELDHQTKPALFAGQKVRVTGTLNRSTTTIHVADITLAS